MIGLSTPFPGGQQMSSWLATAKLEYNRLALEAPFVPWVGRNRGPGPLSAHLHEGFEIGLVLAGEEAHYLDEASLPGRPGECWLCSAWEPHAWQTRASATEVVGVMFLPEFLGEEKIGEHSWLSLFGAPARMRLVAPTREERENLRALGLELRREITAQPHSWETGVRLGLLRLLLLVSRHWQTADYVFPAHNAHFAKLNRIAPAMRLLDADPVRPVSLSEAARASGLSRSRFAVLFRQVAGVSFGAFSLQVRMTLVQRLLLHTSLSVEDIAAQAGFANASHLHRAFRKYHLCTPGQYRLQARDAD